MVFKPWNVELFYTHFFETTCVKMFKFWASIYKKDGISLIAI